MTTKPRSVHSYKYAYAVNLHLQRDQTLPTFSPITRDQLTREFLRVSGNGMSTVALYYTDERVDYENLAEHEKHTALVLKGGPNVIRADTDDQAILNQMKEGGWSEDSFNKALHVADEMQAVLAADGHFKFSLV